VWEKGAGGMRGQPRTGMPAHLCQERAPCAVRAPPARTRAGTPAHPAQTQVRASLQGQVGWQAPACHLPFQAAGRPDSLFSPCGRRGQGGMRGQPRTGMPAHLCQERAPCAVRAPPARTRAGTPAHPAQTQVRASLQGQVGWQAPACHLPFQAAGRPDSLFSPCGRRGQGGMRGQPRTGMPAHLCQERAPCAVRAPPARTRAGTPAHLAQTQVRTPLQGQVGWQAPACHLPFQAAGRPNTPFCLCGGEGLRKSHRGRFLGKPRRAISRFRQQDAQTPLLPVWEKGARGDEGTRGMRDTFVPTLTRRRCPATRTERRGALAGANSLARRNTLAGRADAAILAGLRPNAGARRPAAGRLSERVVSHSTTDGECPDVSVLILEQLCDELLNRSTLVVQFDRRYVVSSGRTQLLTPAHRIR
jgi:hypothetical protein